MTFKSYAQAGQDIFAHSLIGDKGTFLDVGCNHPIEINNTYGLEQIGWTGLLIDNDPNCIKLCLEKRKSIAMLMDAATDNWKGLENRKFDYLSLDCNGATHPALMGILLAGLKFRVITLETDAYRFGTSPRDVMRDSLRARGYDLICADVKNEGLPYEDWWTCKELSEKAERFRCASKEWKDIFNDAK